jgi:hypothetical protein
LLWRYHSRNFTLDNKPFSGLAVLFAKDQPYNTVRSLPGYAQAIELLISASSKGCLFVPTAEGPLYFDLAAAL